LELAGKKKAPGAPGERILKIIQETLDDGKAEDIVTIDLRGKTSIADEMVIASGTSNRHVAALAEQVHMNLKKEGIVSIMEGEEKADWVLIDAYDVIVHIFRPEVREFYALEKMWNIRPHAAETIAAS
jgi:ribosome-associated protein